MLLLLRLLPAVSVVLPMPSSYIAIVSRLVCSSPLVIIIIITVIHRLNEQQ